MVRLYIELPRPKQTDMFMHTNFIVLESNPHLLRGRLVYNILAKSFVKKNHNINKNVIFLTSLFKL
jgi:hypothetical protein